MTTSNNETLHENQKNSKTSKTIVIVDDDLDLLEILSFFFRGEGYLVKEFINGNDALTFLKDEKNLKSISLLILDRILPDMDGLDILRQLKPKLPKIPVLILSILSSEKDIIIGLKEGAIDYISKPFSMQILTEKVRVLLEENL